MQPTIYRLTEKGVIKEFNEPFHFFTSEDIIIKPYRLSICNADFRYYKGLRSEEILKQRLPMALIHEAVGIVESDPLGEYQKGDLVVMLPNVLNGCGCEEHIRENYNPKATFLSSRGDGFMRNYVNLPRRNVLRLPTTVNPSVASFVEPLSVATQLATLKEPLFKKANNIALWGDGNLGFSVSLVLKHFFPHLIITVIGVDEKKLELFNFVQKTVQIMDSYTIEPFDIGIEVVGGKASGDALNDIIRFIKPMGNIMLMGVSEEKIPLNTRDILEKGLTLHGLSRSSYEDFGKTIEFLESPENQKQLEKIIYKVIEISKIDDIHKAFDAFCEGKGKIVMDWKL